MELARIEQLVDKYLNAETTLDEETILSDYFTGDLVATHLEQYKALFVYFAESKSERFTKTIQLKTQKSNWKWLSVAASVVLLFSVYGGYEYNQKQQMQEARLAFEHTQVAFQLLSRSLNKGTNAVMYLEKYETTANKIFKQPN